LDALLLIGAVAVEVVLIIIALKRFGFAPLPGLALIYFLVAQISLTLVYQGLAFNAFMESYSRGGVYTYYFQTMMLYFAASLLVVVSFWGGMFRKGAQRVGSIHVDITRFATVMPTINIAIGSFAALILLIFAMVADWDTIWSNYRYLAMTKPDVITVPSLGIIANLLPFIGIIAGVLAAINIAMQRPIPSIIFTVMWVMISLFFVASHQRVSILPPVAMLVVLSMVATRPFRIIKILTACYAVFAHATALLGRGSTAHHGLSSLFEAYDQVSSTGFYDLATRLLLNLTEGVFVVAEGFARNAEYPQIYKVLSFSPLPSFIDRFSDINRLYQVRLSVYAPFSGVTEAYFFGAGYVVLLIGIYLGSFWVYRRVMERNKYLGLAVGLLILLATIQIFAYPLRNSLKPLWVGNIVGIAALFYLPKRKDAPQINPQLRQVLMAGGRGPVPPQQPGGIRAAVGRPVVTQPRRQQPFSGAGYPRVPTRPR